MARFQWLIINSFERQQRFDGRLSDMIRNGCQTWSNMMPDMTFVPIVFGKVHHLAPREASAVATWGGYIFARASALWG